MYCPNCGENHKDERPGACDTCGLPLAPVTELLAANREAIERKQHLDRVKRDRLIGNGLFLAIAAVPLALGVKNSLAASEQKLVAPKPPTS